MDFQIGKREEAKEAAKKKLVGRKQIEKVPPVEGEKGTCDSKNQV